MQLGARANNMLQVDLIVERVERFSRSCFKEMREKSATEETEILNLVNLIGWSPFAIS